MNFLGCLIVFLVAFAALTGSARADQIDDILARFSADKFPETERAISELVASNHKTSTAILAALADNRLLFDPVEKTVFIKTAQGDLLDAKSGDNAPQVDAAQLKKVRINNAVRRAIEASVGSITLLAPQPAVRLSAAEAVFKSRDAAALAALDQALARLRKPMRRSSGL